ncbi:MAG: NADH-quinone oxidoreductase subunit C [Betaproteobacteria bacterium]|nr:NADH-quinone oxidoreductase subunit C [Betaproteobacteria bacterium]
MAYEYLPLKPEAIAGAVPAWRATVTPVQLRETCALAAAHDARLAALWGSDERDRGEGYALHVTLASAEGLLWLSAALAAERPEYPDLSDLFYCAPRLQRATLDLLGIRPVAAGALSVDTREWLRHGAWPETAYPLRRDAAPNYAPVDDRYAFVPVDGDGVHEIPVGPVHAGTIEPGHFRFSVVGEKVLRLEARLGYTHKGIEKRFEQMRPIEGARLAARVSGDSTVAYAWAYAMALESIAGVTPPARALLLRALLLERERVANHLGDLGYLGNDGGLAFGLAQFMRLKEDWLRLNARLFGHRYLMDQVVPGGVARDVDHEGGAALVAQCNTLEAEVKTLRGVYDEHAGLQDRFITCGRLTPETAARLGVIGLAGRASRQSWDARVRPGFAPYARLAPRPVTHRNGDVAARVTVRFEEIFESLRLMRAIAQMLEPGAIVAALPATIAGSGLGFVEGWRGEVLIALETGADGRIRRCHPHDPSWQNWPAIEHAVIGNIVPDFPLINKSFNLSYSGPDL